MDEEDVVYTMKYYSAIKKPPKSCHLQQYGCTRGYYIMLSEVSQKEKGKYHIISLICGIILKITKTDLHRKKQTFAKGEGYERIGKKEKDWFCKFLICLLH